MDFSQLKKTVEDTLHSAGEKAKDAEVKALDFANDKLQDTPLFIENRDEYNEVILHKRAVILAFDETHEIHKDIVLMLPIWQTSAFLDSSTFRYMDTKTSKELIDSEGYTLPIEMRIFFNGKETHVFKTLESIKAWWASNNRVYEVAGNNTSDVAVSEKVSAAPIDPLSQI